MYSEPNVSAGDFLKSEVYPNLDAVSAGFLNAYHPKVGQGHKTSYKLDCPQCGERGRAYYYAGSGYVNCNRRNSCGESTSIWSVLEDQQLEGQEVFLKLCEAAGVTPPNQQGNGQAKPNAKRHLAVTLKKALAAELSKSPDAINYLTKVRGLTKDQIIKAGLGYYSSDAVIRRVLDDADCDMQLAEGLGYISKPSEQNRFVGRVIAFWDMPDLSVGFVGRAITSEVEPKYLFQTGLDKTVPFNFSPTNKMLVAVEGAFDAISLNTMEIPACAVGGAGVISKQATYLAKRGVEDLLFITDSGKAAIDGALQTITCCEPLGINTYFAAIPEGSDDVDELRRSGNKEAVHNYIAGSLSSGEYLAALLLSDATLPATEQKNRRRKLDKAISALTNQSLIRFNTVLKKVGFTYQTEKQQALRLAAELCSAGLTIEEALKLAKQRFGVTITLEDS